MKLTPRQTSAFSDWIRRKVENPTCQFCQSHEWRIGEIIPADTDSALEDIEQPDMVQLICSHCAHVVLFDTHGVEGWRATPHHDPSRSAAM